MEISHVCCAPSEDSGQPGHPPSLIRTFAVRWRYLGSLAIQWAHSTNSDQTERMSRLIWVLGALATLLVLSCCGSVVLCDYAWAFVGSQNAWSLFSWGGSFIFCTIKLLPPWEGSIMFCTIKLLPPWDGSAMFCKIKLLPTGHNLSPKLHRHPHKAEPWTIH